MILNEGPDPGLARKFRTQFFDNLISAQLALVWWLEDDEDGAGIAAGISAAGADRRAHRLDIEIMLNNIGDDVLVLDHVLERDARSGFSTGQKQTAFAAGYESLGHSHEQINGHTRECAH